MRNLSHMKMSSTCSFIFMQIKVIFRKNGFALRLALKQREIKVIYDFLSRFAVIASSVMLDFIFACFL